MAILTFSYRDYIIRYLQGQLTREYQQKMHLKCLYEYLNTYQKAWLHICPQIHVAVYLIKCVILS